MKNVKGNVFIGWGSSNSLAVEVAKALKKEDYFGIVGGNFEYVDSATVADTVINQLKKSGGAIMLFTEKNLYLESGAEINKLSENMLFEFGYALSKLDTQNILVIYIDVRDELIPSDMRGIWDMRISAAGKTNEELAKEIADIYVSGRRALNFGDKLALMSRPEYMHSLICQHMDNPKYNNDEIAKIIIIYSQAAYIFDDFENADNVLNEFATRAKLSMDQNQKLLFSYQLAKEYFKLSLRFTEAHDGGKKLLISKKDYEDFIYYVTDMIDDVEEMIVSPEDSINNEYSYMFLAVAYEYIAFANMIFYGDRPIDELDDGVIGYRIECCDKCIEYCKKLIETDKDSNENFANLFMGYTYRNLALLHKQYSTGNIDECFEKSISLRKEIHKCFGKNNIINKHFASQMEMEYYLSLSDNLFLKNDEERAKRKQKLLNYLKRAEQKKYDKYYHIDTIRERIDKYCQ